MMELLTALFSILALLVTLFYFLTPKRLKNFPPGPRRIPIFGNAFSLGVQGHKRALEVAKVYGNIIGLYSGGRKVVYINKAEDIREALNKMEFSSRTGYNPLLDQNSKDVNAGLVMSYEGFWQEHRRFTLRTLRDFGFGKRSLEGIIQEEVEGLMEELKKMEGKGEPFSTQTIFNIAAFNVIWSIVAGERFPLDDPKLKELINLLNDFFQTSFDGIRFLSFIFPNMVYFRNRFPFLFNNKREVFREKVFDFFRKTIKEHRQTREDGAPARDFIDSYMDEVQKNEGNESSSFHAKPEENDYKLIVTLFDLFVAGGETTSTTLTWSFFLLALHPEVQEKMYKEIVEAGASSRAVALSDRQNMVYTEAVMSEIFRVGTLTPIAIPHGTSEDTWFKGFLIPKETVIVVNIYGAHYDKEAWGDPEVFRPERFITGEGKSMKYVKNNNLMAFSVGKRECLGMTLAKDEFFLFLTNSIRNFKIRMPDDEPPHTFNSRPGLVNTPEPHKIILKSRV